MTLEQERAQRLILKYVRALSPMPIPSLLSLLSEKDDIGETVARRAMQYLIQYGKLRLDVSMHLVPPAKEAP